ncbi:hypothetical protein MKX01_025780 [Papaver californicum]|nr:hypothetical protein MKX01_025780 [Papaver californicum]
MNPNHNQPLPQSSTSPYPMIPSTQQSFESLMQQQTQKIQMFLSYQRQEIEQINDFKNHQLPLARIKKIMKADEDVRMISAEAPILFSKACELFILELTIRSWLHAEENKRRTLQKNDISAAITRTDIFDFLVDIVPREEEVLGVLLLVDQQWLEEWIMGFMNISLHRRGNLFGRVTMVVPMAEEEEAQKIMVILEGISGYVVEHNPSDSL